MHYAVGQTHKALLDDNMLHTFRIVKKGKGWYSGMFAVYFEEGFKQWAHVSTIDEYVKRAMVAEKKAPGTANTEEPATKKL